EVGEDRCLRVSRDLDLEVAALLEGLLEVGRGGLPVMVVHAREDQGADHGRGIARHPVAEGGRSWHGHAGEDGQEKNSHGQILAVAGSRGRSSAQARPPYRAGSYVATGILWRWPRRHPRGHGMESGQQPAEPWDV